MWLKTRAGAVSMARPSKDIVGKKFFRLTVLKEVCTGKNPMVLCECECGKKVTVYKHNVIKGNTKSCGCWRADRLRKPESEKKPKKKPVRFIPVYDDDDDEDFRL